MISTMTPSKAIILSFVIECFSIFYFGHARPIQKVPNVILISVDGLRFDYLQSIRSDQLPNFSYFKKHGSSVKYVKNVFPSVTYPNHMSIISGLYPESHGVVHNVFADEFLNDTFHYDYFFQNFDSRWFDNGEEVIYVTNKKGSGTRDTGSALWPAGLTIIKGIQPRTIGRAFSGNMSLSYRQRVDYIIDWFTDEKRPVNLGLLYFDEPDEAGHKFGAESPEITKALERVDTALGYLIKRLNETDLLSNTNIILTGDHGMISTDKGLVNIDTCIDSNWYTSNRDHDTVLFIYPKEGFHAKILDGVRSCSNIYVYTKESEQLKNMHLQKNYRVPPIVLEAKAGYIMVTDRTRKDYSPKGGHGYDPEKVQEMRPFFVASGPSFKSNFTHIHPIDIVDIYPLMCEILKVKPAPNNGSLQEIKELLISPPAGKPANFKEKLFETTGITFFVIIVLSSLVGGIYCIGAIRQSRITARKRRIFGRVTSSLRDFPAAKALLQSDEEEGSDDL
ncbi:ectonucleotide pyrophosphatase/phosphodiesterase family member 5-like [Saccostrea echinata]|uniref:ectonucleotide pyrophosphatase/phosphodiesterase family member 5-like n=1 Tax=Saccostrea echinata TaxID=191078 RepID=UPI002A80EED1|nr:ectonucleotide pyrophosphatase/phosphodiesterase family member 5-like [Saccostrea echinata]